MQKIADFMMSKKFIPVALILVAASFFLAFTSEGGSGNDNPKSRNSKILRNVGLLLEQGHFEPKKIDDAFSKSVFKRFLEDLDGEKNILLASDVSSLTSKYGSKVDDEIHGSELESFYAVNKIYLERLNEVSKYYSNILAKPFDFSLNETFNADPEKNDFPKNEGERQEMWRKRLKYMALSKFVDLQEEREKNKDKKDFVIKPDSTLEREARETIKKQVDRFFATKKNRETEDENFSTFVNAITGTMDPHTTYFPPVDLRSFNESMSGHFFGIGAQLKEDDGKIKIASLITGGPAWKSGELKENDEIIKVGQGKDEAVDVTGYSVSDAVKLIRGSEKGTEVVLTVRRIDGSIKEIRLLRDDIKLEDTYAKSAIINGEHKIGYIYLPEFYADFERPNGARCYVDVARELEKLKAEKVDGIILDLRGNGGGSLYDVVKMAGLFIEDGPICQVKGRDDKPNVLKDTDKSVQYDGPFAVMVDETSASASEIFAAAIQDYKRGVIVGSTSTYGKGTVQRNIPLNPENQGGLFSSASDDLGSVKLTLQKFYRINGDATQLKGVTPDLVLPDRLEYLKFREKDNPNALPWDEIQRADYKTWTSNFSTSAAAASAIPEVNTNTTFGQIKTNVQWLEKQSDRSYSLNIDQYKQDQKQLKKVINQIEDLYKLKNPLNIQNVQQDVSSIQGDTDKVEKNKQWLKVRGEDIYIDETVKVVNKMIAQNNLAKTN
jgi:carboxyl-terminal processing protease